MKNRCGINKTPEIEVLDRSSLQKNDWAFFNAFARPAPTRVTREETKDNRLICDARRDANRRLWEMEEKKGAMIKRTNIQMSKGSGRAVMVGAIIMVAPVLVRIVVGGSGDVDSGGNIVVLH